MSKTHRSSTRRDDDAIKRVREILWPRDDPERQWTPDTLDRIAEVVMPSSPLAVNEPKRVSDAELRVLYGRNAIISRKARFTLVHLDNRLRRSSASVGASSTRRRSSVGIVPCAD